MRRVRLCFSVRVAPFKLAGGLASGQRCMDACRGTHPSPVWSSKWAEETPMVRRKLIVRGRGPDARVTVTVEVYRGKVWITSFDCPFTTEAILEPAQADSLVDLVAQAVKEARGDTV